MTNKPIPLSIRLQDYLVCVLLHLMFPLLPLGLEYWITQNVAETSLTLMASVYAISIGLSSSSPLLFAISLTISFIFSFAFGIISAQKSLPLATELAITSIMAIFLIHAIERYKLHIIKGKRFWVWFNEE